MASVAFILSLVCFWVASVAATRQDEAIAILDSFWERVDKKNIIIANVSTPVTDRALMEEYFRRLDNKDAEPNSTNIYEDDFSSGTVSWRTEHNCDLNASISFFKQLDLHGYLGFDEEFEPDFDERIDYRDVQKMIYVGDDGDGNLTETEFKQLHSQTRGLPFGVMFLDYRTFNGSGGYYSDYVFVTQWFDMFQDIDRNGDDLMEVAEISSWWTDRNYGSPSAGDYLGSLWVEEITQICDTDRWLSIFYQLDVILDDAALNFDEFMVLDFWFVYGFLP